MGSRDASLLILDAFDGFDRYFDSNQLSVLGSKEINEICGFEVGGKTLLPLFEFAGRADIYFAGGDEIWSDSLNRFLGVSFFGFLYAWINGDLEEMVFADFE